MKKFIAIIQLPAQPNQEYVTLIPDQRLQISQLMSKGVVSTFVLNEDHSFAWMTMNVKSEKEAQKLMSSFALYKYMDVTLNPIAVFDSNLFAQPKLLLN